jgi:hypothetical protein
VETACGASPKPSIDCGGVVSPDTTRSLAIVSWTKTLFLLGLVSSLAVFAGTRLSGSLQGTDFPDFYCPARMLAEGGKAELRS